MKTLIVSALVLALAAASAHAQIFDIQVNPGGGNPQYTGTGADTMSGSNLFNQVTGIHERPDRYFDGWIVDGRLYAGGAFESI